jgi:tripartite-type tricarboxylate transporter receptor subunit TctC
MLKVLFIILISANTYAQTTINGVWAFNIANTQGTYFRHILENANNIQQKYIFTVENRPGAGGAIAAQSVHNRNNISILGTAAAFFVRPYLYSTNTYTFEQFKVAHVMAISPAALVTKNKDLNAILSQHTISIGTSGAGSLTHLMALKFKEYYPTKNIIIVNYKSSTESLQDIIGSHIDLTFEFLGDAEAKDVKILGTTGSIKIKNYPLLKDIGYPNQSNLVGIYLMLVKKDTPDNIITDIRNILIQTEKSQKVQELYALDYSHQPSIKDYSIWYRDTIKHWETITKGITVE